MSCERAGMFHGEASVTRRELRFNPLAKAFRHWLTSPHRSRQQTPRTLRLRAISSARRSGRGNQRGGCGNTLVGLRVSYRTPAPRPPKPRTRKSHGRENRSAALGEASGWTTSQRIEGDVDVFSFDDNVPRYLRNIEAASKLAKPAAKNDRGLAKAGEGNLVASAGSGASAQPLPRRISPATLLVSAYHL